ncbi:hypothetical protein CCHL11_02794, partial [Colletotrichum chlorophyti]
LYLTISVAFFSLSTIFYCVLYLIGLMLRYYLGDHLALDILYYISLLYSWAGSYTIALTLILLSLSYSSILNVQNIVLYALYSEGNKAIAIAMLASIGTYRGIHAITAILSASNDIEL